MQSSNKKLHLIGAAKASGRQISPDIWLSLVTGSFLLGVLGSKAISESLLAISEASEEVFRGDRLPILHLSDRDTEPTVDS